MIVRPRKPKQADPAKNRAAAKRGTAGHAARTEEAEDAVNEALRSIDRRLLELGALQDEVRRTIIAHGPGRSVHASDLLGLSAPNFVEACYVHLFGRLPDPAGRKLHLSLLSKGESRERLLLALHRSPEARALGVRMTGIRRLKAKVVLDRILGAPAAELEGIEPSLAHFLRLDGERLVRALYKMMLRRDPDQLGLEDYVERLKRGAPKSEIIGDIVYSPEGRLKKARLSGLWWRYVFAKLSPGRRTRIKA